MSSLTHYLTGIVGESFEKADLPAELGVVRLSDRPDLAQFQCNGAMAAAKVAKKNPREIAQSIKDDLDNHEIFRKVEIAGPGFINLDLTDKALADFLGGVLKDERYGASTTAEENEKMILDYGGPNIAKPMHVGHLRASIIGDTLRRIFTFAGYETLGDVHMGDWGTHMGMIISEYLKTGRAEDVLQVDLADDEAVADLMQDLSEMYPNVSAACKNDETRKAEALEATVKIQAREPEYYTLWQKIKDASVIGMRNNFAALNVHFDLWKGEADVHDYIAPMVEELKDKGLAVESEGALVVDVSREDDKKDYPPLILYKKDGAVMYGTTDMATLVERMKLYSPSRIIYVVDQRQHMHFEQVFRSVRKAEIVPDEVELTHAGFGTMNGPDGKPFKTRAGGVMRLEDLIKMAREKALARMDEAEIAQNMPEVEKQDVASKVAIAAIKFADLQNQRVSDYIFDLDRFARFEGKTGPYLLYQTVRIKSLLRKAGAQGDTPGTRFDIREQDRDLALVLCGYDDALRLTLENYAPHHLCDYAYKLAATFSSFYGNCHILSEQDEALKSSRLALCALTAQMLEHVLDLLGMDVPEKM